jgi:hypothetical protein
MSLYTGRNTRIESQGQAGVSASPIQEQIA